MAAQCTLHDVLLTARSRMTEPADQREVYRACRHLNPLGLLTQRLDATEVLTVAMAVDGDLAKALCEANTLTDAVEAFFTTAEANYVCEDDRMLVDQAVLYLFDRLAYGLATGDLNIGNTFGVFYAKLMSIRIGEQIDRLRQPDDLPLLVLEIERLEALMRRFSPNEGLFAYAPMTWSQVLAIRELPKMRRLFAAGIRERLFRALHGRRRVDNEFLRTDEEFFALLDQIRHRMETRGQALDDLADAFRRAYGFPPSVPVTFDPGLSSIHLHGNNSVVTTFGRHRGPVIKSFVLKL